MHVKQLVCVLGGPNRIAVSCFTWSPDSNKQQCPLPDVEADYRGIGPIAPTLISLATLPFQRSTHARWCRERERLIAFADFVDCIVKRQSVPILEGMDWISAKNSGVCACVSLTENSMNFCNSKLSLFLSK